MHQVYFCAAIFWNLCQTSMQPDSKQRKWYLRLGTFNIAEGLPQRLQMGSIACVKSQRLVGQPRAVLCLWAICMGFEVSRSLATDLKKSVSTALSFYWHQWKCFKFGKGCKRWIQSAVRGGCEISYLLLHSKKPIFLYLSNSSCNLC